jgi:site-specific DNA-adenine methylase
MANAVEELVYEPSTRAIPGGKVAMFPYVGGRSELVPEIMGELGKISGDLIDPFFGSGAVPFSTRRSGNVGGVVKGFEANTDIVNVYKAAKNNPDQLFNEVKKLYGDKGKISQQEAMSIRNRFNAGEGTDVERAAMWTIIARHAQYNKIDYTKAMKIASGMHKIDKNFTGSFTPEYQETLKRAIEEAGKADIKQATATSYLDAIRNAKRGDVVFLDPPYTGRTFNYPGEAQVGMFTDERMQSMLLEAQQASARGVRVVVTDAIAGEARLKRFGFKPRRMKSKHGEVPELIASAGPEKVQIAPSIPAKRTPKAGYENLQDLRQNAMDEAHKWYYKEYTDYTNANAFDAIMKQIYPFWTYESQRWFWLPRSFMRHPGTFTEWSRYTNNTDYGYLPIPGTSVEVNPFRGTVYGTLTTRLSRRDYPEYYDSVPYAGGYVEFMDFLSRYGFYPGAAMNIPMALAGGKEPQLGEVLPAVFKTPLAALIAAFPDNKGVEFISDIIFNDRFRDYLTMRTIDGRGGNGSLIFAKIQEDVKLTDEEQALWDDSRREAALYSTGFEQFGMARLRTEEQRRLNREATALIEEMTGFSEDQQTWMRRHGVKLWDELGGLSPTQTGVLQELDNYANSRGTIRALLPSEQQNVLNKVEIAWENVRNFSEDYVLDKKLQLQTDFLGGVRGASDYDTQMRGLFTEQKNYIFNKMKDLAPPVPEGLTPEEEREWIREWSIMTLDGRMNQYKNFGNPMPVMHPMFELLNLYFSIELKERVNPETMEIEIDWDRFWSERDAIERAIPQHLKQEWEDYLSRNSTRLEELRREIFTDYFKPYYDIWDTVMARYDTSQQTIINEYLSLKRTKKDLDRIAEIEAMLVDDRSLVSSFQSDVGEARRALRYANPMLDAWLFYWGKTSSFLAPGAEEAYLRVAKQTGRRT